jgi:hypothetical protein
VELKLPLERECIFDIFIFPTPIRNKIPTYVESTSIKAMKNIAVKNKVDELNTLTYSVLEDVVEPINDTYIGMETYYKKMKYGIFNIKRLKGEALVHPKYSSS